MGGKAHKNYNVNRISSDEREELLRYFQDTLQDVTSIVESPIPIPEKNTHGDLDLIVVLKENVEKDTLHKKLASIGLYDEQEGKSYLINLHDKIVQVDLMFTSKVKFPLVKFIASYGDLGMILGLYAKKSGFSLGPHAGLEIKMVSSVSGIAATYPITKCPVEICDFFGLSHSVWQNGFESTDAIFQWLLPVIHIGQLDTTHKLSDRTLYQQYIIWSSSRFQPIIPFIPKFPASFSFADVSMAHGAFEAREQFRINYKKIFCADTVNNILSINHNTTFTGKELGAFMAKLRLKLQPTIIPTRADLEAIISDVFKSEYICK